MVGKIDRPVNSVPIQKNPDRPQSATRAVGAAPRLRRRLGVAERERLGLMARATRLVWVLGNHDPDAPVGLPGEAMAEHVLGLPRSF